MKRLLYILVFVLSAAAAVSAQDQAPIVASITADSVNVVILPDALMNRLQPQEAPTQENNRPHTSGTSGWRVQIFSDNNARTAKNEARSKEQQVAARFPQYRTYRRYQAPYWRVRVGDFRTQGEASAAAAEIRRAFPSFGGEVRVVRDRITPSSD